MEIDFLKRLKKSSNIDPILIEESTYLAKLKQFTSIDFNKIKSDQTIKIVEDILLTINKEYYELFIKMINEQDCSKPVIYSLNSRASLLNNESNTYNQEIFFYKTGTTADIYLLLHEFSHYLVNRNNSFLNDYNKKRYDEIIPILMELIISRILNNQEYLKFRINEVIFYAKSVLIKEEIRAGNYNINYLFTKYNLNSREIKFFKNDLLYNKSLEYEEEKRYIYGLLYGYYYFLRDYIGSYNHLVEEYSVNRNILFPTIHFTDIETNTILKKSRF